MRNQALSDDDRETRRLRKLFADGASLAAICQAFELREAVCLEILRGERSLDGKRPALADDYQQAIDQRFLTDYLDTHGADRDGP